MYKSTGLNRNLELTRIQFYPLLDHFALRGNGQTNNETSLELQKDGYSPMSPQFDKKRVVTFIFLTKPIKNSEMKIRKIRY